MSCPPCTGDCHQGRDCPAVVNSELPVVMFNKPFQWLRDLIITAIYRVGTGTLILLILGGVAGIAYGIFYR